MAAFGIVQYLTDNGKFFWFYEHGRDMNGEYAQGSFTNRNHFAQFLTLGTGPLVWWVWQVIQNRSETNSGRRHQSPDRNLDPARPRPGGPRRA